jgi:hypothetical protein
MIMRKQHSARGKHMRSERGASGMSEFGPALMVLLIAIFFPLIDLLSVCVSYGLIVVLNNNQAHEASLLPYTDAGNPSGTVMKGIPDTWLNGMGHFVKKEGAILTQVGYRAGQKSSESGNNAITDRVVRVTTTVKCTPFLPIPLPVANVPGLNGPMVFTVSSERQMENPDFAPQS